MSQSEPRTTLGERVRYRFDNVMGRGAPALIGLLGVATVGFVALYALAVKSAGILPDDLKDKNFIELGWYGLMRAMDAGTLGGDSGAWVFLLANLTLTTFGIFVVSSLIGVINAGIEDRLASLRKGRSRVVEREHSLIIGWNASAFTLISELSIANQNRKGACIVVLADRDKVELEDAIRERLPDLKGTRVVCRTGDPCDPSALSLAAVDTARAILVVAPEDEDADVQVIKTLLAIVQRPERKAGKYHIVAELHDEKNRSIAQMIGKDEVEIVLSQALITNITVQCCRQSGLSVVHTELLDFDGDEIYFADAAPVVGKTFGDALHHYRASSLIGLVDAAGVQVLPDLDRKIVATDRLIAISKDDDTIVASSEAVAWEASLMAKPERAEPRPERALILGFNERGRGIVQGLEEYVTAGSEVVVVAEGDHEDELRAGATGSKQTLTYQRADTTDRKVLESLAVETFDHLIVLSADHLSPQRADARVLVTLLHLREMGERLGKDLAIVSEMRDVRNRQLAEATDADDFIVSEKLVSLMMSQVAENKQVHAVLQDLFDPDGAEIYLKPAAEYVTLGTELSFSTLVAAARQRGEIAIGYRVFAKAKQQASGYGVRINPDKTARFSLSQADKVVVIATS
jgi:voltage-gated potassium channel Kch